MSAFALLMRRFRPLDLPISLASDPFGLHIVGSWACFALVAVLASSSLKSWEKRFMAPPRLASRHP
jgi:hypothetical protein